MGEGYCIANAIVIGVVLNIVLPMVVNPFATGEEKMPKGGAASLDSKGQFVHMLVHHGQVPIVSSFIVALIVGLSVSIGYQMKPVEKIMSLMK
jgi:predicted secreted protein|tara:strand:+ start:545 stop:823 length:279 start_codon:yes stop_codon:yes gene_type:complete